MYDVESGFNGGAFLRVKQWQVINTTTWKASDSLTVKNILSYAEFTGDQTLDLFGLYNPAGANIQGSA